MATSFRLCSAKETEVFPCALRFRESAGARANTVLDDSKRITEEYTDTGKENLDLVDTYKYIMDGTAGILNMWFLLVYFVPIENKYIE